ncbi:MAG: hypothetical protein RL385_2656 [Pseudomonadota bacterium]
MSTLLRCISTSAVALALFSACSKGDKPAEPAANAPASASGALTEAAPSAAVLRPKASALFGKLPATIEDTKHPSSEAKISLGRTLYFEHRLSKNQDLSCNSCHALDGFGADTRAESVSRGTSLGHKQQFGDRNSPSVYNAALHVAQFWDGRAADVEAQAKGPILNAVEMAMPNEASVVAVLKSIPGYEAPFKAAFPGDADPISYNNLAEAIGAFERTLVTPAPLDKFIAGDDAALSAEQLKGLDLFLTSGCIGCHSGPGIGGAIYQKLGLVVPFETKDEGRAKVTGNAADKFFFKVPSLRNVEKTAPYFHDGAVKTLPEAVRLMAKHQTALGELSADKVQGIVAFLTSLTGELPVTKIAKPELPPSGPKTPKADPS